MATLSDARDATPYEISAVIASSGWFASPHPNAYSHTVVEDIAPVVNPFAPNFQRRRNKFTDAFSPQVSIAARTIFMRLWRDRNAYRQYFSSLSAEGYNPHFSVLPREPSKSQLYDESQPGMATKPQIYVHDKDIMTAIIHLDDILDTNSKGLLTVSRFARPGTGQYGYFLVNDQVRNVSVNGTQTGIQQIAGPLPEFCVIEIGQAAVFWWRTRSAFQNGNRIHLPQNLKRKLDSAEDYLSNCIENIDQELVSMGEKFQRYKQPIKPNKRRKTDRSVEKPTDKSTKEPTSGRPEPREDSPNGEYGENVADSLPYSPVLNPLPGPNGRAPTSWEEELEQGYERSRPLLDVDGFKLPRQRDLNSDHIVLAIASVWRGLREVGIHYGLGPVSMIDDYGEALSYHGPPRTDLLEDFIMPVMVPRPQSTSKADDLEHRARQIGHLVLAVAQRTGDDGTYRLHVFDSCRGLGWDAEIFAAAETVFHRSERPGSTATITRSRFEAARRQRQGSNTCGIHTILNAWAVMLGLELEQSGNPVHSMEFYGRALGFINLALHGRLSGIAIVAFLQLNQFVRPVDHVTWMESRRIPQSWEEDVSKMQCIPIRDTELLNLLHQINGFRGFGRPSETAPRPTTQRNPYLGSLRAL